MSILTTICDAIEHRITTKYLGGYKKAAQIDGNLNLLHRIQDSGICPSHFIEEEEIKGILTLDDILGNSKSNEIDLTGTQQH